MIEMEEKKIEIINMVHMEMKITQKKIELNSFKS